MSKHEPTQPANNTNSNSYMVEQNWRNKPIITIKQQNGVSLVAKQKAGKNHRN